MSLEICDAASAAATETESGLSTPGSHDRTQADISTAAASPATARVNSVPPVHSSEVRGNWQRSSGPFAINGELSSSSTGATVDRSRHAPLPNELPTTKELLNALYFWMGRTGTSRTAIGVVFEGNTQFINSLEEGRQMTPVKVRALLDLMAGNPAGIAHLPCTVAARRKTYAKRVVTIEEEEDAPIGNADLVVRRQAAYAGSRTMHERMWDYYKRRAKELGITAHEAMVVCGGMRA